MFKKLIEFFHNRPGIKTTVVGAAGSLLTAAGAGAFGAKGAAVAGAITAVVSLFTKRPQDGAGVPVAPAPEPEKVATGKNVPNFYTK